MRIGFSGKASVTQGVYYSYQSWFVFTLISHKTFKRIWHHYQLISVLTNGTWWYCWMNPISMAWCKTAVSPLLTYWRYCTPALSHWYMLLGLDKKILIVLPIIGTVISLVYKIRSHRDKNCTTVKILLADDLEKFVLFTPVHLDDTLGTPTEVT